jgi:anti-anti-sigma factor
MATKWSEDILIAELADEPSLSEELAAILQRLEGTPGELEKKPVGGTGKSATKAPKASKAKPEKTGLVPHVVLNFANVTYIGSSNIGQLLQLRKELGERKRLLKLCSVSEQVWSIFQVTGVDKLFRFAPDPMTALAGIQIEAATSS